MSESLNSTISIQLLTQDTNSVTRFFHDLLSIEPSDYKYGRLSIGADEKNKLLAKDFHYVFFKSDDNVEYKIGEGGMGREAKLFFHCGDLIDVYISNNGNSTIELEYVCAKKE